MLCAWELDNTSRHKIESNRWSQTRHGYQILCTGRLEYDFLSSLTCGSIYALRSICSCECQRILLLFRNLLSIRSYLTEEILKCTSTQENDFIYIPIKYKRQIKN